MTDEAGAYRMLYREYPNHEAVNHIVHEYVRGNAHTNALEGWFALLKVKTKPPAPKKQSEKKQKPGD